MPIHGKNGRVYADEFDLTPFAKSVSLDTSVELSDITTLANNGKKYLEGLKDATMSLEGVYDGDKDEIDNTLNEIKTGEALYSYYPAKDTKGNIGYCFKGLRSASATQVSITENVNFSLATQTTEGTERVKSILAKNVIEEDGVTASLDLGAGGTDGAVIYLHVFDVDGEVDIVIQDSSDDTIFDTLVTQADIVTSGAYRLTVSGSVGRYIRISVTGLGEAETVTIQAGIKLN
jgi:hypothetical protein